MINFFPAFTRTRAVRRAEKLLKQDVKFPATYMLFYWINNAPGCYFTSNLDNQGVINSMENIRRGLIAHKDDTIPLDDDEDLADG
jgi:hypothetical protein